MPLLFNCLHKITPHTFSPGYKNIVPWPIHSFFFFILPSCGDTWSDCACNTRRWQRPVMMFENHLAMWTLRLIVWQGQRLPFHCSRGISITNQRYKALPWQIYSKKHKKKFVFSFIYQHWVGITGEILPCQRLVCSTHLVPRRCESHSDAMVPTNSQGTFWPHHEML